MSISLCISLEIKFSCLEVLLAQSRSNAPPPAEPQFHLLGSISPVGLHNIIIIEIGIICKHHTEGKQFASASSPALFTNTVHIKARQTRNILSLCSYRVPLSSIPVKKLFASAGQNTDRKYARIRIWISIAVGFRANSKLNPQFGGVRGIHVVGFDHQ